MSVGEARQESPMPENLHDFLNELRASLGDAALNVSRETRERYGENKLPTGDRQPAAVLLPASVEDVECIVAAANRHRIVLYPISTGQNQGMGLRSAVHAGQVVVDLGRRMNRIVELDETLAYAVIEPGVTYQQLYDELGVRGHRLMLDTTSGPPQGGVLGNTMDSGAGYTPYFDHLYMSCGMEVVLGNGQRLRTGDGALPGAKAWHVSKYSIGPKLDGLFVQSNFGITTRLGVWLMPRPPCIRGFFFSFPDDDDLEEIVELCRPLKLANMVPTLFKLTNDVYAFGTECSHPEYHDHGGARTLSDAARRQLQRQYGSGAWLVSGAFYGASEAALAPFIERVKAHFLRSGKATYIDHDSAEANPMLRIHLDSFRGVPTVDELKLLNWRPGGGLIWFLPGTPMIGRVANEHQRLARRITSEHGFEYICEYVAGARFARGLHVIIYNREDEAEKARADACYRALAEAFASAGYSVGRAATGYHGLHMAQLDTVFTDLIKGLKATLDPNGVIAHGKYQ